MPLTALAGSNVQIFVQLGLNPGLPRFYFSMFLTALPPPLPQRTPKKGFTCFLCISQAKPRKRKGSFSLWLLTWRPMGHFLLLSHFINTGQTKRNINTTNVDLAGIHEHDARNSQSFFLDDRQGRRPSWRAGTGRRQP
jgi:hypothetical protein